MKLIILGRRYLIMVRSGIKITEPPFLHTSLPGAVHQTVTRTVSISVKSIGLLFCLSRCCVVLTLDKNIERLRNLEILDRLNERPLCTNLIMVKVTSLTIKKIVEFYLYCSYQYSVASCFKKFSINIYLQKLSTFWHLLTCFKMLENNYTTKTDIELEYSMIQATILW